MTDDDKKAQTPDPMNPLGLPDLGKMLEQLQVPGVDIRQLADDAQKNIEALQEANRTVVEGWRTLAEKQMEMFQQTVQRWQDASTGEGSAFSAESAEKQAQLAREGIEQTLAHMKELAEIATQSQSKAFEIMRSRFEENMRNMFQPEKGEE
jgi:phasin family protein